MPLKITRAGAGTPIRPTLDHHAVSPHRLHGQEAGQTEGLVVTLSEFATGASVDLGPVPGETVYYLLAGHLTIETEHQVATGLGPGDSAYLPAGTVRSLRAEESGATVLVTRSLGRTT